jgi:hypothetical protein
MKLLLDEHIALAVGPRVSAQTGIEAQSLQQWLGGQHLHADDEVILRAAHAAGLTLVTYDRRTIGPLLTTWGNQDIAHGGVIFIDERSIAQDDVGGVIRALVRLVGELGDVAWQNRVVFLRP